MLLPAAHLYELLRDAAVTCQHNTGGDLCEAKRAFSEPSSHPHNFQTVCRDGADAQGGSGEGNKLQRISTGNWEKTALFSIKSSSVT